MKIAARSKTYWKAKISNKDSNKDVFNSVPLPPPPLHDNKLTLSLNKSEKSRVAHKRPVDSLFYLNPGEAQVHQGNILILMRMAWDKMVKMLVGGQ